MRLRSTSPTLVPQQQSNYPIQHNNSYNPSNRYYNINHNHQSNINKLQYPPPEQYNINIIQPNTNTNTNIYSNSQPIINNSNYRQEQINRRQKTIPISMKNYQQTPNEVFSTYPLLITQLENKNMKIQEHQNAISHIKHQKQEKQGQINTLNNVIHSFYTKGAPLQSAKARQIFDGSYPTLIQQADAMRQKLAIKNQQLYRLKLEKGKQAVQLMDAKYRVVTYGNRIRDLQYKLEQVYRIKQVEIGYVKTNNTAEMEIQNAELKRKIMQMQNRNSRIAEQNDQLIQVVRTMKNSKRKEKRLKLQPKQVIQPPSRPAIEVKEVEVQTAPQVIISHIFNDNQPEQLPQPTTNHPQQQQQQQHQQEPIQKQSQIKQLQQRLTTLRQQNSQLLQQQQTYIQQIYNEKQPEISILDDKQRDPFQLSKNNTTTLTLDISKLWLPNNSYGRKNTGYSVDDIEERIRMLRNENSQIMSKK